MQDRLLTGRRKDYSIYERIFREIERLKKIEGIGGGEPEYPFKCASHQDTEWLNEYFKTHYIRDNDENAKASVHQWYAEAKKRDEDKQEHYKKKRLLEEQLPRHEPRPDARHHQPCPHCGATFPFVLRPINVRRYDQRDPEDFNEPKTAIEFFLIGSDHSLEWYVNASVAHRSEAMMDYYYKTCNLPINPFEVRDLEDQSGFTRKFKPD